MTARERNEHLIDKWGFLLQPLEDKKSSRARYAKIFENTALHTNTETLKIALSLAQKILYITPDTKVSSSAKNNMELFRTDLFLVIDGNTIMPDGAATFIDQAANSFKEKFDNEEITKINHVRISRKGQTISASVIY